MIWSARWKLGLSLFVLAACSSSADVGDASGGGARSPAMNAPAGGGDHASREPINPGTSGAAGMGGGAIFGNPVGSAGAGGSGAPRSAGTEQASEAGWGEPSNQAESYTDVGVNPFVMVAYDPFSTFAADVDSASYDIFRRDVNLGLVPRPASVRLEEYVNYFHYDYPAPAADAEHPFAIDLAAAPHPSREGIALLRVGIQARLPADTAKKAANLVFLIDTSGSMQSAEKLPLVQRVLRQALTMLDPTDTVSIVTYASGTRVALEPTLVQSAAEIESAVDALSAGGSTNGAGGIQLAYQQAEDAFIDGGINHVVLCTDGDFNVGASSDEALVALIEQKRETGVTLTALGFGIGNLNDSMMEKVSNAGNGIYAVISSPVQADMYVEDRLISTLEHVAKDVKIQLELNPEHVVAYRQLGYENRAIADDDFRDDMVDAGEIGAGHRVTALYELVLAGNSAPDVEGAPEIEDGDPVEGEREIAAEDMVLVKLRYKQPGASTEDPASELSSALVPSAVLESFAQSDQDLKWAVAIAMLAEVIKVSPYADAEADLDAIETTVSEQADRDPYRAELVDLFDRYRTLP